MAAKVVFFGTNKGGDGKTFGAINFADYSANVENKKTLLIDLDPQGNSSSNYIQTEKDPAHPEGKRPPIHPVYDQKIHTDWDGRSSIAGIFYGETVYPYETRFPNLHICVSHASKLLEAERVTRGEVKEKIYKYLQSFINFPEIQNQYDVIVLDTPPSKGPLTVAAIKACTHMVIPAQMEIDSIEGIYGIMQLWKQEVLSRQTNDPIELVGIFANKFKKNTILHTQFYEQLKTQDSTKNFILEEKISQRIVYAEVRVKDPLTKHTKSIFELSQKDEARKEVENVCKEIMRRVYTHG